MAVEAGCKGCNLGTRGASVKGWKGDQGQGEEEYVEKGLRDWSLITGRGATKLKGGGGASEVLPPS